MLQITRLEAQFDNPDVNKHFFTGVDVNLAFLAIGLKGLDKVVLSLETFTDWLASSVSINLPIFFSIWGNTPEKFVVCHPL